MSAVSCKVRPSALAAQIKGLRACVPALPLSFQCGDCSHNWRCFSISSRLAWAWACFAVALSAAALACLSAHLRWYGRFAFACLARYSGSCHLRLMASASLLFPRRLASACLARYSGSCHLRRMATDQADALTGPLLAWRPRRQVM